MAGWVAWISVGVAALLIAILAVFYVLTLRRGRRLGTRGLVQRSRLTCPRCHQEFDYDFVPGASFSAIRLGKGRYMACPLCHQWGYFDLSATRIARPTGPKPP
jgi:hypothetical protein